MTELEKYKACVSVARMLLDGMHTAIDDQGEYTEIADDALCAAESVLQVAASGCHSWDGAVPLLRDIISEYGCDIDQFILDAPMAEDHGGTEA